MKKRLYIFAILAVFTQTLSQCSVPKELHYYIPCRCPRFETYKHSYRIGYFTVRKIYSYDGMRLIYVQGGDSIYKIYSTCEQDVPSGGRELIIDSTYYLYLQPEYADLSPGNNRFETCHIVERHCLSAKNTGRKYCVYNAYTAANIIDKYVYDGCYAWKYVDMKTRRHMRLCRKKGFVDEPKIELPEEWDYLPEYNASSK